MRQLTQCPSCKRQFDATGHAPGGRYHCHCGAGLIVPSSGVHDASVVRCSQCGGARAKDELECKFCGGSFTLHERDLHTICPSCLARISDRARFCHHCATRIEEPQALGSLTSKSCPVCSDPHKLTHRTLAHDSAVLECARCAGLWVGNATFIALTRKAMDEVTLGPPAPAPRTITPQAGPMYRRCVECSQLMVRQNFGRKSGVIIDSCRGHGVWLDVNELERVLEWLRAGHRPETAPKRAPAPAPQPFSAPTSSSSLDALDALSAGDLVFDLIAGIFDAF